MKNILKIISGLMLTFLNSIIMGIIIWAIYYMGIKNPLAPYIELPYIPFYVFSSLFIVFMFLCLFFSKIFNSIKDKETTLKEAYANVISNWLTYSFYILILWIIYLLFY